MRRRLIAVVLVATSHATITFGDDILHRYEGDVPPYDESAGWNNYGPCVYPCSESLEDGHFVLRWPEAGGTATYNYMISEPPEPSPPSLWVEWRFRSNHPMGPYFYTCDAGFIVVYGEIGQSLFIYGDAVIPHEGSGGVRNLNIDEFHTYRFESVDGLNYWFSVDGEVFLVDSGNSQGERSLITFVGRGGCSSDQIPNKINEWDHVRFGTISYGEQIVSSDPPAGFVNAREHAPLDRFTVTFDSANYVYIDEIGVNVTSGVRPVVIQTRRLDNGDPETVEIVLDRPIPFDASTKFLFNDGATINRVIFTFAPGDTDGDGDADLRDFAAFQICFGLEPLTGACLALDSIADDSIDLADYAGFEGSLRGP